MIQRIFNEINDFYFLLLDRLAKRVAVYSSSGQKSETKNQTPRLSAHSL